MRALAEYIMQGKKQALAVAIIANAVPILYWLGSAAVGLVVLRRGVKHSLPIIMLSSIPSIFWALHTSPTALLCLLGTVLMAHSLRLTTSWVATLTLLIPLGATSTWAMIMFYMPALSQAITASQQISAEMFSHLVVNGSSMDNEQLKLALTTILLKGYTLATLASMLIALVIARNWQAKLYNPGGFKEELYTLRLPTPHAVIMFLFWILGLFSSSNFLQAMSPGFFLPLIFAGLALAHSVIAMKKSSHGRSLLVIVYLLLLLVYPLIIVLACCDSFVDFRGRLAKKIG